MDDDDVAALNAKATSLREAKRFDEADQVLGQARVRFPLDLASALGWALIPYVRGDLEAALRRWMDVVDEFPGSLGARCRLSMVLTDLARHEEAEAALAQAESYFPDHRDIAVQRAMNATERGLWSVAIKQWHDLHHRFPDDLTILNQLNRVRAELQRDYALDELPTESTTLAMTSAIPSAMASAMTGSAHSFANDREMLLRFEGLGGDCEIGLMQRHFGHEPLDLFRWAGISDIDRLTHVLDRDLADLVAPDAMSLDLIGPAEGEREYVMVFRDLSLVLHSWIFSDDARSTEKLLEQFKRRLVFLRRNFLETLETGDKIFIFKDRLDVDRPAMLRLHQRLLNYGPNRLLVVQHAGSAHRPGDIEMISPGLAVGYLARLGHPEVNVNGWNIDFTGWSDLLKRACLPSYLGNQAA